MGEAIALRIKGLKVNPRVLDRLEQVAIVCLWTWLLWRVSNYATIHAWLILSSQTVILFFVLVRRPTDAISVRLDEWALALVGSFTPSFVVFNVEPIHGLSTVAVFLLLLGDMIQIWAKLILSRSFGIAPANRGIKFGGPYKIIRHPMYAGYCISELGMLIAFPSPINAALFSFVWMVQLFRLRREEAFLANDPAYQEIMKQVRWRLIPGVF
jgi:protein-S-isoprenylcysteine O-methyltransferase Ste14